MKDQTSINKRALDLRDSGLSDDKILEIFSSDQDADTENLRRVLSYTPARRSHVQNYKWLRLNYVISLLFYFLLPFACYSSFESIFGLIWTFVIMTPLILFTIAYGTSGIASGLVLNSEMGFIFGTLISIENFLGNLNEGYLRYFAFLGFALSLLGLFIYLRLFKLRLLK